MNEIMQKIYSCGIIPVVVIDDAKTAVPLAKAILHGGIYCIEVTLRTTAGIEAIRKICADCPDILVCAGTVLSADQAESAIEAGASFIVSPGFNDEVVSKCRELGTPIIPGCATPSEIEHAMSFGIDTVKIFPAEQLGGCSYIKALSGPYRDIRFMPTGGISAENIDGYMQLPSVAACGGSWMVKPELITAERYNEISELCRTAINKAHGFEFAHVGINAQDDLAASVVANSFTELFSVGKREASTSIFASESIEIMKSQSPGAHGHIGFSVSNVERTLAYLDTRKIAYDKSASKKVGGKYPSIYIDDEIGGFAVHITERRPKS